MSDDRLRDRFGIGHATLQIETDTDAELCRLRPHEWCDGCDASSW